MQRIAGGVYLKDRISIADILFVTCASRFATTAKWFTKIHYLKLMIRQFTTLRVVYPWHFRYWPKIIDAVKKLYQDEPNLTENSEQILEKALAWISVRLNKTPHEIKNLMTPNEITLVTYAILIRDLRHVVDMCSASHPTKEFFDYSEKTLSDYEYKMLAGKSENMIAKVLLPHDMKPRGGMAGAMATRTGLPVN